MFLNNHLKNKINTSSNQNQDTKMESHMRTWLRVQKQDCPRTVLGGRIHADVSVNGFPRGTVSWARHYPHPPTERAQEEAGSGGRFVSKTTYKTV